MTIEHATDPGIPDAITSPEAPSPQPFRFGAQHAIFVFLAYVGVQLAVGFFIGVVMAIGYGATHPRVSRLPAEMLRSAAMAGAFFGLLGAGIVAYWLARRTLRREAATRPLALLGWASSARRTQLAAALVGVLLGALYLAVANLVFPIPKNFRPGLIGSGVVMGGWALYAWIVMALAIAPVVEEFVFRGMLWTGLSRSWGPLVSAAVVTLLFVALHVPEAWGYWPALVAITLLGIAALIARILSRSLAPPVFLHAGYNAALATAVLGAYL